LVVIAAPDPEDGRDALYSRAAAAGYGRIGAPLFEVAGRRLVELAGVKPGQRVLDIATGRGAVLFPAAERVLPDGSVLGVDLSLGMLELTAADIAQRGLRNAAVQRMDADALDLHRQSFDAVLCSFAVFFLRDVVDSLRQIRELLVPGGVVGFAFARDSDPRWQWYEQLVAELVRLEAASAGLRVRDEGVLVEVMRRADFADAHETVEQVELYFTDAQDWWASLWTHGTRQPLERLDATDLERLRTTCLERVQAQMTDRGLPISFQLVYVLGRSGLNSASAGSHAAPPDRPATQAGIHGGNGDECAS
jgi:ubiquinone/menaquinone biosynthesis C-methylase UbiE